MKNASSTITIEPVGEDPAPLFWDRRPQPASWVELDLRNKIISVQNSDPYQYPGQEWLMYNREWSVDPMCSKKQLVELLEKISPTCQLICDAWNKDEDSTALEESVGIMTSDVHGYFELMDAWDLDEDEVPLSGENLEDAAQRIESEINEAGYVVYGSILSVLESRLE